jgi:hypothetical protein
VQSFKLKFEYKFFWCFWGSPRHFVKQFWHSLSFGSQKRRDLNKPISKYLYTTKVLSFYNVSRVGKNWWFFDHPLSSSSFLIIMCHKLSDSTILTFSFNKWILFFLLEGRYHIFECFKSNDSDSNRSQMKNIFLSEMCSLVSLIHQ